jgi:hypothetical protein
VAGEASVVAAVAEAEAEAKATAQKMNWLQGAWRLQGFTKKSRFQMKCNNRKHRRT